MVATVTAMEAYRRGAEQASGDATFLSRPLVNAVRGDPIDVKAVMGLCAQAEASLQMHFAATRYQGYSVDKLLELPPQAYLGLNRLPHERARAWVVAAREWLNHEANKPVVESILEKSRLSKMTGWQRFVQWLDT